jgi:hypothetical protein
MTAAAPPGRIGIPEDVARALLERVRDREIEQLTGEIALAIRDQWRLANGDILEVRYHVPAGETQGYLIDAVTGRQLTIARICRAHHIVEHVKTCHTCTTDTCGACPDQVQPCTLCATAVCGQCAVSADRRCPACSRLRKVGLLDRRRLGVPAGVDAWYGADPRAQVLIRNDRGQWSVTRWDHNGQKSALLVGEWLATVKRFVAPDA